jgi:tetratricopeptide (TPR) repeat protein
MIFAQIGITETVKAVYHQSRAVTALAFLFIFLSVSLTVGSSMANIIAKNQSKMDAVLEEAYADIGQDNPDPAKLRQAIALLEANKAQYPQEIRFPLYLAEAYYRSADPGADVNREYHNYEKTGSCAEQALALDPSRAEAHYWHGLFLLRKAHKQGGIGAFFTVRKGIAELEQVRRTMPAYDHAGASRVLGLLYYLAPGWTPFGSLTKSIAMEEEATRLAPDFSLNRLYLANAYKKQGDKEAAIREYQAILNGPADVPAHGASDISEQARTNLRELGVTG